MRMHLASAEHAGSVHVWLAATCAQLGQREEARTEVAEVLRIELTYTIDGTERRLRSFKFPKDAEHYFEGLHNVRGLGLAPLRLLSASVL
jgi:hypothetical protein